MPAKQQYVASDAAALAISGALMKIRAVSNVTAMAPVTIYRKVAAGKFPQPVRLGVRCTRWRSDDVRAWLASL